MTSKEGSKGVRGANAQGNWYEYSVDLSAYAGQAIYVAIRHFNCTDMFYIDVDDVTFTADDKTRDGMWYYYDNGVNEDAIGTGGSIKAQIDEAINKLDAEKSGSSHGVSVTVKETDGKIESVTVDAPDFANTYDEKGAANAVLGSEGDDPSKKTVYGVSAAVDQVRGEIDTKIGQLDGNATGSNNGVSVTVRQTDGVINEVTVDNRLLGDVTDTSSANTIYGAKAAAHDVQGNESDTKDDKTVYGAFAAIQEVKDGIDSLKSISEEKIRNLFC